MKLNLGREKIKKMSLLISTLFCHSDVCCPPHSSVPFWTSLSFLHNKRTRLLVSYTGETILFSFCQGFSLTRRAPRLCDNIFLGLNKQGGDASGGTSSKIIPHFHKFIFQEKRKKIFRKTKKWRQSELFNWRLATVTFIFPCLFHLFFL